MNLGAPAESIIEIKKEKMVYKMHRDRLKAAGAMVQMDTPACMNLQHLVTRAKKKQLTEDRHQIIANENRKLMDKMTSIMNENRNQVKPVKIMSMNERIRRQFALSVNQQNKTINQRLEHITPIIKAKKLEDDFGKHLKLAESIKKRGKNRNSPSKSGSQNIDNVESWGSTFDSDAYLAKRMSGSNIMDESATRDSEIQSMAEFRKQIISKKRAPNTLLPIAGLTNKPMGGSQVRFEGLSGSQALHEMKHEPVLLESLSRPQLSHSA